MTEEKKLEPELRFPGFHEPWEEKKLGEKSIINSPSELPSEFYYIDLESVKNGYLNNNLNKYKVKNAPSRAKRLVEKDDILYSTVRPYLKNHLYIDFETNNKFVASTGFALIKSKIDVKFQYYNINTYNFTIRVLKRCTGTSYPAISTKDLSSISFFSPSLQEQEKIGKFFYAIDKKLNLQRERIEELKSYKKGMMQRIFDQEIRFKDEDGRDYPDWEEKKLGDVTKVLSSSIRSRDLKEIGTTPVYDAIEFVGYTNLEGVKSDYISIIKDGSGVGRVKILPKGSLFIATMNGILVEKDNLYFIYLLLKNINFSKYIVGSGIPHIYYRDYSKEKIELPSLPEQEKIANFLSAIDRRIELEEEKLELYEDFKKGLMQRMFV